MLGGRLLSAYEYLMVRKAMKVVMNDQAIEAIVSVFMDLQYRENTWIRKKLLLMRYWYGQIPQRLRKSLPRQCTELFEGAVGIPDHYLKDSRVELSNNRTENSIPLSLTGSLHSEGS